ncbi:CD209 antigen-like protein A [Pimephales promelas]|uniref:CD209 antigen-like protein A n=1 Tax=Pimephales promelas TaxID=90988 RepID=UPI0019557339|nr:CD209 antigen-like protein A [Pimephales promelas]
MEIDTIYQNVEHKDVIDTRGSQIQSHSQDEGQAQKKRGSRCLVLMTVCLGLICVLLLVFVVLQHITITDLTETNEELKANSGHVCFSICNEEMSWNDSRQFCRDRGADLVIINTEEKQKFITSFIKERMWIGLFDNNKANWTWVDNSLPIQTFWDKGEPNGLDENCTELDPRRGTVNNWNDLPCSWKFKCICEK